MKIEGNGIVLLGPYPGNLSFSLANYFNFYRKELPRFLPGKTLRALCPGEIAQFDLPSLLPSNRSDAWLENYIRWPSQLIKQRAELFHIVDQGLTWYARFLSGGKRIATIHDLIAHMICRGRIKLPRPPLRRRPLIRECIRQIKKMDHLLSVSTFTADCLMRELSVPASRITVVHNHIDECFYPLSHDERRSARTVWFGDAEYVVIHVGKPSVYKNRIGALRAFELLWREVPQARMFLVHGKPDVEELSFLAGTSCARSIKYLPPLSKSELRQFYGAADVLIFPSLYEGFGWPPLEAMACGCPVVSTTRASLREVVGDAGITIDDPHDHFEMAKALKCLLKEPNVAREMRERGLQRVKLFSPHAAVKKMTEVYRGLL